MYQLGRQGDAVRPRERQSLPSPDHPGGREDGARLGRPVLLCPLIGLLQAERGLGGAIELVGVDVEYVLAGSREGSSGKAEVSQISNIDWEQSSCGRWNPRSLQGEKGLLKPSAADHYIPLCL